jgi:hypothetical protein
LYKVLFILKCIACRIIYKELRNLSQSCRSRVAWLRKAAFLPNSKVLF